SLSAANAIRTNKRIRVHMPAPFDEITSSVEAASDSKGRSIPLRHHALTALPHLHNRANRAVLTDPQGGQAQRVADPSLARRRLHAPDIDVRAMRSRADSSSAIDAQVRTSSFRAPHRSLPIMRTVPGTAPRLRFRGPAGERRDGLRR